MKRRTVVGPVVWVQCENAAAEPIGPRRPSPFYARFSSADLEVVNAEDLQFGAWDWDETPPVYVSLWPEPSGGWMVSSNARAPMQLQTIPRNGEFVTILAGDLAIRMDVRA